MTRLEPGAGLALGVEPLDDRPGLSALCAHQHNLVRGLMVRNHGALPHPAAVAPVAEEEGAAGGMGSRQREKSRQGSSARV